MEMKRKEGEPGGNRSTLRGGTATSGRGEIQRWTGADFLWRVHHRDGGHTSTLYKRPPNQKKIRGEGT